MARSKIDKRELEKIIVSLWNKGNSTSKIGMILKEKYKIYDVREVLGMKLTKFLRSKGLYKFPEDLKNLIEKNEVMKKHLEINKKDFVTKRRIEITGARIRKMAKYYKEKNLLPSDWKY